jgi:Flp pilus assembly protein TadG
MMPDQRTSIFEDIQGASAIEFAIVGPIFLMLTVGMIYVCLMLFSMGSMQYAVEAGARCASVKTTICPDSTTTIAFARAAYYGPVGAPTFTYANAPCGHSVSSSTNFALNIILTTLTVPLAATACYP